MHVILVYMVNVVCSICMGCVVCQCMYVYRAQVDIRCLFLTAFLSIIFYDLFLLFKNYAYTYVCLSACVCMLMHM